MPDHVHLLIQGNPFDSPTNIVKIFKGVTSLGMFKKFPQLHQQLWLGYYGFHHIMLVPLDISAEAIEKNVQAEQTK
jgi:REP element-mobilizing transposase RayT